MRSPLASAVAGLLVLVGLLVVLRPTAERTRNADELNDTGEECALDPGVCAEGGTAGPFPQSAEASVLAAEVCPRAAYLCHGLRERGVSRIMRWPNDVDAIEIRIPLPESMDVSAARDLQAAAARGVLAWQNSPFPLRIVRSDRPGSEDFAISWGQTAVGNELGRTATEWDLQGGVRTMRVVEMVLSTHAPGATMRPLDAGMVALTAAHEMGHALGLPHSDDERDLMYPTNTAPRMSTRDYRAMEALYSLENGAALIGEAR